MLSEDKKNENELWARYLRDKSQQSRDELVLHYIYLVKCIVLRLLPTYEQHTNYDDLVSCGILGLIDAINKYDITRDVKFEYYAAMRIKGEIIDQMRKQDWAPSSLRRKIQDIGSAYLELENMLGRTPTDAEVAEHLGMEEDKLHNILEKMHAFNVISLEETLSDENFTVGHTLQDSRDLPDEHIEKQETSRILGEMIDNLPEKERLVLTLYYYEELTLKEIANILKVSESRASQIHSKAILKLRTKMKNLML